jgi:DHA2 family multidrug resistance protein-like MFS transporter
VAAASTQAAAASTARGTRDSVGRVSHPERLDGITRATGREWIGLAVLGLPCLLYSMDLEVLYLAVPSIAADLQPSSVQQLWIFDIYGFLLAGSLITMGTLGDRFGRRRLLLVGAAGFGVASVLAAYSRSAEALIASRALLGVAGATLAPSTLSLIRNMFLDDRQRTFAVSIWATCFSVGAAIGPLVGGVLLEYFWWGSVFLAAVPIMALTLLVGPIILPESRDQRPGRIDLLSAVLSVVAVLAVIYGFKVVAAAGNNRTAALAIALGIVMAVAFVRRQSRLDHPLVELSLFKVPTFTVSMSVNWLGIFVLAGTFLFITQYLQLVVGLSPLRAGLCTVPSAVALIAGSLAAPLLGRHVRRPFITAIGLLVATVGCALLALASTDIGFPSVIAGSVLLCLGIAPVITLATDSIVSAAPPERAGSAASLSETSVEMGGSVGIAVLGSVGVLVYRNLLGDNVAAAVPRQDAARSLETLGGATDVSSELPGRLGAGLLDAAQSAFTSGLVVASVGCGVIMTALAIVAVSLQRGQDADAVQALGTRARGHDNQV